jgi:anti-sigma factor RsiW
MTGPAEADREEVAGLLVFLANGTLDAAERERVEAAVAADPDLQAELAVLRQIRERMQDEPLPQSPGEFGHARLMRDIAREPKPSGSNRLWQGVAAAALALLVVQTVLMQTGNDVRLAGGGVEAQDGPVLTVAFSGTATEADIRALLIDLDLTIVSGPSALGLYRLAAKDEAARAAALARLAAATGVVESAEAEE